jgi:hypothetical protein
VKEELELELQEKGIFNKGLFVVDPWFNKDNFKELTAELDKFNLIDRKNRMKVNQLVFTTQKKFKMGYLFNPPTIYNLEKQEFHKKYKGLNYLMNLINSQSSLNIGNHIFLSPLHKTYNPPCHQYNSHSIVKSS